MNRPTIKKLSLLAALPAAILIANSAMAGVDVYGKINVSLQQTGADQDNGLVAATNGDLVDNSTLESNASRFGIKASTDLGDTGLKAVAKIEYQVFVDDGSDGMNNSGDELSQRNIYGGLQGGFGTVIAGNFDTPMKESQGKVDMFNDYLLGDINNVLLVGERRAQNIVMYSTPKLDSGLGANIAAMSGEETGLNGADENSGMFDYVSASVTFDSENFYAALAHDTASPASATVAGAEITRLVGQVKMGAFTLGAIYQMADTAENTNDPVAGITAASELAKGTLGIYNPSYVGSAASNWNTNYEDQDGLIISGSFTLAEKHVFKAQYGTSTASTVVAGVAPGFDTVGNGDLDITLVSVGYDYWLDKKSKLYAYASDYQAEHETKANVKREVNADTIGLGFEYSF